MGLKGSKTEQNLKDAFAGESQANRRYLYFANKADVEGQNDVAALFRSTAEGETGHAHGHLEFLEAVGDPATGLPIGRTRDNLKAAVAGETHEYTDMYPGMAKHGARRRLRRDRRLVRDAGQGRALARQPLPEGARRAGRLTPRRRDRARTRGLRAPCSLTHAHGRRANDHREGNLEAPTRHPIDWKNPEFYDEARVRQGAGAHLRHLPRLPPLREPVPVRSRRCSTWSTHGTTARCDGVDKADYWKVVDQCYLCDLCYMTKCPYVPPHPWNVDFPHTMLRAKAIKFKQGRASGAARSFSPSTDVHGQFAGIPVVVQMVNAVNKTKPMRKLLDSALRRAPRRLAARAGDAALSLERAQGRRRRRRSRTASARRARWRSSRPATSTTTSPASATTCSRCSSTTRSRT